MNSSSLFFFAFVASFLVCCFTLYLYVCLYFAFLCYHNLVNKDLYNEENYKDHIPLRYPGRRPALRPGRRPVASRNLAYHALSSSLARASRSGLRPGLRPGRRPVASWNLAYHALSSSLTAS